MRIKRERKARKRMIFLNTAFILLFFCCLNSIWCKMPPFPSLEKFEKFPMKGQSASPCSVCTNLVKSFIQALDETTRQSFEGGDADWEKEKLGSYENSELRFIEIQERLCINIDSNKDQCFNFAEKYEHELEDWFFKKRFENKELFNLLCIDRVQVCCPENTYGPQCIPCPGGIEQPCSGHGICLNGGTREIPASCNCDVGYTGKLCSDCSRGYYRSGSDSKVICKPCDKSCKEYCRGPSPKDCEVCSKGYHFSENDGCIVAIDPDDTVKSENVSHDADDLNPNVESVTTFESSKEHSEL